jgi:hypothetical protein
MKKLILLVALTLSLFGAKQQFGIGLLYQGIPTCSSAYATTYYSNLGLALRYKEFDASFSQAVGQVAYRFWQTKGQASMSAAAGVRSGYDLSGLTAVVPIGLELKVIGGLSLFSDYVLGYQFTSSSYANGFVSYIDAGFRYYF